MLHIPPISSYAVFHPVWRAVEIMYFLRQYLPFASHLSLLSSKYLSQRPQPIFFTQYGRPDCTATQDNIKCFVIVTSSFLPSLCRQVSLPSAVLHRAVCASAVCRVTAATAGSSGRHGAARESLVWLWWNTGIGGLWVATVQWLWWVMGSNCTVAMVGYG